LYKALTDQSIDAASSMRIAFLKTFLLNILWEYIIFVGFVGFP
jgi:hypothetical protein